MRIKVRTPRGIRSIDLGGGDSTNSYRSTITLDGSTKLVTHNKGLEAVSAYYKDSSGWYQPLKVNTDYVSDSLNECHVYSSANLGSVEVVITF